MKKIHCIMMLLLTPSVLAACASANIQKAPLPKADNSSNIIIFRPELTPAEYAAMIVALDDTEIAVLENGQYVSVDVEPGEHTVSVRGKIGFRSKVTVEAKPFGDVYLEAAGRWYNSLILWELGFITPVFYITPAKKFDRTGYRAVQVTYSYN